MLSNWPKLCQYKNQCKYNLNWKKKDVNMLTCYIQDY